MKILKFFLVLAAFSVFLLSYQVCAAPDINPDTLEHETLIEEYLLDEAKFMQKFSDGRFFKTTIPNGQITPGMVKVEFPKNGLTWSLKVDGEALLYSSGDYLYNPGSYLFTVLSPESGLYGEYGFTIAEVSAVAPVMDALTVSLPFKYYDDRFNYSFENGRMFSATVPNGGITSYGVKLWLDSGLICLLTRDGAVVRYNSGDILTQDGYYHMLIISPMVVDIPDLSRYSSEFDGAYSKPENGALGDESDLEELDAELKKLSEKDIKTLQALTPGATYQTSFTFRIITKPTRSLPVFNVPEGFEFDLLSVSGERITPSNERFHRLARDGEYAISLKDIEGLAPNQFITATIDTTPPNIVLGGVVKGYEARGPVSVLIDDETAAVTVFHNGIETSMQKTFESTGVYYISAADAAGNTADVSFEIKFAPSRRLVLVLILLVFLALAGYVVYSRHSMKIN